MTLEDDEFCCNFNLFLWSHTPLILLQKVFLDIMLVLFDQDSSTFERLKDIKLMSLSSIVVSQIHIINIIHINLPNVYLFERQLLAL